MKGSHRKNCQIWRYGCLENQFSFVTFVANKVDYTVATSVHNRPVYLCESRQDTEGTSTHRETVKFGYTRKDVILIGAGLIGIGYTMYYGLQAVGLEAGLAGNWVQLIVFLGICVGWLST